MFQNRRSAILEELSYSSFKILDILFPDVQSDQRKLWGSGGTPKASFSFFLCLRKVLLNRFIIIPWCVLSLYKRTFSCIISHIYQSCFCNAPVMLTEQHCSVILYDGLHRLWFPVTPLSFVGGGMEHHTWIVGKLQDCISRASNGKQDC